MEIHAKSPWGRLLSRLFFDPWIAMLSVGALGHQLNKPALYHVAYWSWILLVIAVQSLWGSDSPDYKLVFKQSKKEKK